MRWLLASNVDVDAGIFQSSVSLDPGMISGKGHSGSAGYNTDF